MRSLAASWETPGDSGRLLAGREAGQGGREATKQEGREAGRQSVGKQEGKEAGREGGEEAGSSRCERGPMGHPLWGGGHDEPNIIKVNNLYHKNV